MVAVACRRRARRACRCGQDLAYVAAGHCGDGGARASDAFKDSAANQIDQVTESTCAYWSGPSCAKTGLMFACSSTVHVSGYTIQR
jgi:hypothetical protein